MIRKGIILAGGAGSRLYPLTLVASKQLQAVYDKPMVYYPLSTLMLAGIQDFLIISSPEDTQRFEALLGDGSRLGIKLTYKIQNEPKGIAEAFLLGEEFINNEPVSLILGDNIFYGRIGLNKIIADFNGGAKIFGYPVNDPERYGVVEFDRDGNALSLEEKPVNPKSHFAVPGLYLYDQKVVEFAKALRVSPRGELEITDLNLTYQARGELAVERLGRGIAWLDTGTHRSLLEASQFIETLQLRQGVIISSPEEIAFRMNYITQMQFEQLIQEMPESTYRSFLELVLREQI